MSAAAVGDYVTPRRTCQRRAASGFHGKPLTEPSGRAYCSQAASGASAITGFLQTVLAKRNEESPDHGVSGRA